MPKHRGPILKHQNDDSRSPSHFMVMAKNSSKSARLFDRETTATSTALVDLGLELGNKRSLGQEAARAGAISFENVIIYSHLLSLGGSWSFSQTSQIWRSSTRTRNPSDADGEKLSGAKNPPVRSCLALRKRTNEPNAHRVARNT